ncbi:MAG: protein kinase [Holophaga sp.]|nr:protein kinase [Holophaga sp.]
MPLAPESKLGPYEIVGLLGSGGMGEVYRARDRRLGREIAIKVLLPSFAADPDRMHRFEQEAKAVALLNHPGILQIYDTGLHEGMPYLVMELLEGETLRERMDGRALSMRKALDLGQQIVRGLAAAHEKGLTHRDLKPENIFLTRDDRTKILDFGLAKLRTTTPVDSDATLAGAAGILETKVGMLVGTVGYMSPEQVNGHPADPRSDIFAFGVILWEMITGRRPFGGDSAVEVMHAILKSDPPDLPSGLQLPPAFLRTLQRCLEKDPRARFQSAQDLAFELENLLMASTSGSRMAWTPPLGRLRRIRPAIWAAIGGVALLCVSALWVGRELTRREPPTLQRITYRSGNIESARFTPDAQSFVYSLARTGVPSQLWLGRAEGLGAHALDLPAGSEILSISATGEMALLLRPVGITTGVGTLARAPLGGGAPREIMEKVYAADWGPDGRDLAVVRIGENGRQRLEYPIGRMLFEVAPPDTIDCPKVSPTGDRVAFSEIRAAGNHVLTVVDGQGRRKSLAQGDIQWLAWSPNGKEILYTHGSSGDHQDLRVVTLSGQSRFFYSVLGRLSIQDVSHAGKVLLRHTLTRQHLCYGKVGEAREWELSWLQSSKVADLSPDGKGILFAESREGVGPGGAYFRKASGADPIRLGDGDPLVLSPDGKWAVVRSYDTQELVLLPTGPGEPRHLPKEGVKADWAVFLDAQKLLLGAAGADKVFRYYVQDLATGVLKPWRTEPGSAEAYCLVAPDRTQVAFGPVDGRVQIYSASGKLVREISGLAADEIPLQWSADGRELFVWAQEQLPARIWRFNLTTGKRTLLKELMPPDTLGVSRLNNVCITPDGTTYAYSFLRILTSDLYFMEGWK